MEILKIWNAQITTHYKKDLAKEKQEKRVNLENQLKSLEIMMLTI